MIVVGVAITEVLRKTLFKASMLPGVGADTFHQKFENHFRYLHNGKMFLVGSKGYDISLMYAMLMLVFLICAYVGYRQKARNLLAIDITMTLYTLSIFVFGVLDEVRLYQPMTGVVSLTVIYLLFETGLARNGAPGTCRS
ncbi:hypothetical protein C9I56_03165 [Paraburkholderia caribensis]|nr:hypothetical protein C9I56_03165 [Paraburkholderia caribensis]